MATSKASDSSPARQADEPQSANAQLMGIYADVAGEAPTPEQASATGGIFVSIILPALLKCIGGGATPASIAALMKKRPIAADGAIRQALRDAGYRPLDGQFRALHQTMLRAAKQATESNIMSYIAENSF
jgi:hypothetical protein